MKELNIKVTIDEANQILEGLGNMPFARVHSLIGKIQEQASEQLHDDNLPVIGPSTEMPGPPKVK